MIALGHDEGASYAKNGMGAVAAVVGVKAGVIENDVLGFDALFHGVTPHGDGLVIVRGAVVAAQQQNVHFAGMV